MTSPMVLVATKVTRAMAHGAKAAIAADDGVKMPKVVHLACLDAAGSGDAAHRTAIEHHDHRAVMVVILASEREQKINVRAADTALLHARARVSRPFRQCRPGGAVHDGGSEVRVSRMETIIGHMWLMW